MTRLPRGLAAFAHLDAATGPIHHRQMRAPIRTISVIAAFLLGACPSDDGGGGGGTGDCAVGDAGCPCAAGTCMAGLVCQDDVCVFPGGDGSATSAGATTAPGDGPGSATSGGTTATDATTAPATTTVDSSSGDDMGSTGSGAVDLGPCARVAECFDATGAAITPFLDAYGEDGTCWTEFTAEQCWQDCSAMFEALTLECDTVDACCECLSDAECTQYTGAADTCAWNECVVPDTVSCDAILTDCGVFPPELVEFSHTLCAEDGICPGELIDLAVCYSVHFPQTYCDSLEQYLDQCFTQQNQAACAASPCQMEGDIAFACTG